VKVAPWQALAAVALMVTAPGTEVVTVAPGAMTMGQADAGTRVTLLPAQLALSELMARPR